MKILVWLVVFFFLGFPPPRPCNGLFSWLLLLLLLTFPHFSYGSCVVDGVVVCVKNVCDFNPHTAPVVLSCFSDVLLSISLNLFSSLFLAFGA